MLEGIFGRISGEILGGISGKYFNILKASLKKKNPKEYSLWSGRKMLGEIPEKSSKEFLEDFLEKYTNKFLKEFGQIFGNIP